MTALEDVMAVSTLEAHTTEDFSPILEEWEDCTETTLNFTTSFPRLILQFYAGEEPWHMPSETELQILALSLTYHKLLQSSTMEDLTTLLTGTTTTSKVPSQMELITGPQF